MLTGTLPGMVPVKSELVEVVVGWCYSLLQFDQPGRAFRCQWDQMLATYRFLQAGLLRLVPELMSEVPLE